MVKLIKEEDYWPSLASELDEFFHLRSLFTLFFLSFIHREFNSRADLLSKDARMKNSEFFHVNIFVHPGLAKKKKMNPFHNKLPILVGGISDCFITLMAI